MSVMQSTPQPRTFAGMTGRAVMVVTIVIAVAAALPLVLTNYQIGLATEILIFGILAMSIDILAGFAGRTSLGHGAIFGVSTYVVVYATAQAVDTGDADRTWAIWAAAGYGVTTVIFWLTRHKNVPLILPMLVSLAGALAAPVTWLASRVAPTAEVKVISESAYLLLHHGTPYLGADIKMRPAPGSHRGAFMAWDPVARRKAWSIDEDFPVRSGALATAPAPSS